MPRDKGMGLEMKKSYVLALAIIAAIGLGAVLCLMLEPAPPSILVFPYIMENEQESTSSDTNPWWPDGWSANMYHGLTSPLYASVWYQIMLENLGWMIEVDNFGAHQTSENVINANTLLTATKNEWATSVAAFGWYVPETKWGECLIIVAQGPKEGLPYLLSKFGELTPEAF